MTSRAQQEEHEDEEGRGGDRKTENGERGGAKFELGSGPVPASKEVRQNAQAKKVKVVGELWTM